MLVRPLFQARLKVPAPPSASVRHEMLFLSIRPSEPDVTEGSLPEQEVYVWEAVTVTDWVESVKPGEYVADSVPVQVRSKSPAAPAGSPPSWAANNTRIKRPESTFRSRLGRRSRIVAPIVCPDARSDRSRVDDTPNCPGRRLRSQDLGHGGHDLRQDPDRSPHLVRGRLVRRSCPP